MRSNKYFFTVLVIYLVFGVTGCSLFSSSKPEPYQLAENTSPLQIPNDLSVPSSQQKLALPDTSGTGLANVRELEFPPQIEVSEKGEEDASKTPEESGHPEDDGFKVPKRSASVKVETVYFVTNMIKNEDGISILKVDGAFLEVWPRVGDAVKELGFDIDDSNVGDQLYSISKLLPTVKFDDKEKLPGEKQDPDVREIYQIHVEEDQLQTDVTVRDKNGKPDASGVASHLLVQIQDLLSQRK